MFARDKFGHFVAKSSNVKKDEKNVEEKKERDSKAKKSAASTKILKRTCRVDSGDGEHSQAKAGPSRRKASLSPQKKAAAARRTRQSDVIIQLNSKQRSLLLNRQPTLIDKLISKNKSAIKKTEVGSKVLPERSAKQTGELVKENAGSSKAEPADATEKQSAKVKKKVNLTSKPQSINKRKQSMKILASAIARKKGGAKANLIDVKKRLLRSNKSVPKAEASAAEKADNVKPKSSNKVVKKKPEEASNDVANKTPVKRPVNRPVRSDSTNKGTTRRKTNHELPENQSKTNNKAIKDEPGTSSENPKQNKSQDTSKSTKVEERLSPKSKKPMKKLPTNPAALGHLKMAVKFGGRGRGRGTNFARGRGCGILQRKVPYMTRGDSLGLRSGRKRKNEPRTSDDVERLLKRKRVSSDAGSKATSESIADDQLSYITDSEFSFCDSPCTTGPSTPQMDNLETKGVRIKKELISPLSKEETLLGVKNEKPESPQTDTNSNLFTDSDGEPLKPSLVKLSMHSPSESKGDLSDSYEALRNKSDPNKVNRRLSDTDNKYVFSDLSTRIRSESSMDIDSCSSVSSDSKPRSKPNRRLSSDSKSDFLIGDDISDCDVLDENGISPKKSNRKREELSERKKLRRSLWVRRSLRTVQKSSTDSGDISELLKMAENDDPKSLEESVETESFVIQDESSSTNSNKPLEMDPSVDFSLKIEESPLKKLAEKSTENHDERVPKKFVLPVASLTVKNSAPNNNTDVSNCSEPLKFKATTESSCHSDSSSFRDSDIGKGPEHLDGCTNESEEKESSKPVQHNASFQRSDVKNVPELLEVCRNEGEEKESIKSNHNNYSSFQDSNVEKNPELLEDCKNHGRKNEPSKSAHNNNSPFLDSDVDKIPELLEDCKNHGGENESSKSAHNNNSPFLDSDVEKISELLEGCKSKEEEEKESSISAAIDVDFSKVEFSVKRLFNDKNAEENKDAKKCDSGKEVVNKPQPVQISKEVLDKSEPAVLNDINDDPPLSPEITFINEFGKDDSDKSETTDIKEIIKNFIFPALDITDTNEVSRDGLQENESKHFNESLEDSQSTVPEINCIKKDSCQLNSTDIQEIVQDLPLPEITCIKDSDEDEPPTSESNNRKEIINDTLASELPMNVVSEDSMISKGETTVVKEAVPAPTIERSMFPEQQPCVAKNTSVPSSSDLTRNSATTCDDALEEIKEHVEVNEGITKESDKVTDIIKERSKSTVCNVINVTEPVKNKPTCENNIFDAQFDVSLTKDSSLVIISDEKVKDMGASTQEQNCEGVPANVSKQSTGKFTDSKGIDPSVESNMPPSPANSKPDNFDDDEQCLENNMINNLLSKLLEDTFDNKMMPDDNEGNKVGGNEAEGEKESSDARLEIAMHDEHSCDRSSSSSSYTSVVTELPTSVDSDALETVDNLSNNEWHEMKQEEAVSNGSSSVSHAPTPIILKINRDKPIAESITKDSNADDISSCGTESESQNNIDDNFNNADDVTADERRENENGCYGEVSDNVAKACLKTEDQSVVSDNKDAIAIKETPEERANKVSILSALGLQSLHSFAVDEKTKKPDSSYTGTLKAVIKLSKCGDKKSEGRMFFKQGELIEMGVGGASGGAGASGGGGGGDTCGGGDRLEYRICSEPGQSHENSTLNLGAGDGLNQNRKALPKHMRTTSLDESSSSSVSAFIPTPLDTAVGEGSGDDKAGGKQSSLVIPEKSSSFSIHPGRLCSDICSYCFGKFGSLDTPCHLAQLKNAERQQKILANESHLKMDSCLCDGCYRYVDRKANCPQSQRVPRKQRRSLTNAICSVQSCDQPAHHSIRRKWLIKLKKSIGKKLEIDMDKNPHLPFPLCSQHYYWVDYFTVCGICKKRLSRNHMYALGSESDELNVALKEDGIPVRLSDKLFLCKLCRYYSSLRLKYRDQSTLTANHKLFLRSYRKKILAYLDISVSESEEDESHAKGLQEDESADIQLQMEEQPKPKKRKTKTGGPDTKKRKLDGKLESGEGSDNYDAPQMIDYSFLETLERKGNVKTDYSSEGYDDPECSVGFSNIASFLNPSSLEDRQGKYPQDTQPRGRVDMVKPTRIQVKFGNLNIRKLSNLNIGQDSRPPVREKPVVNEDPPDRPPYLPGERELPLNGELRKESSHGQNGWERCTLFLQFDMQTKKLWNELQRPYGNQSSFLRHLIMLEKYWRDGSLALTENADPRAVKYNNSVQNRVQAFDGKPAFARPPSTSTSMAASVPLATPPSNSNLSVLPVSTSSWSSSTPTFATAMTSSMSTMPLTSSSTTPLSAVANLPSLSILSPQAAGSPSTSASSSPVPSVSLTLQPGPPNRASMPLPPPAIPLPPPAIPLPQSPSPMSSSMMIPLIDVKPIITNTKTSSTPLTAQLVGPPPPPLLKLDSNMWQKIHPSQCPQPMYNLKVQPNQIRAAVRPSYKVVVSSSGLSTKGLKTVPGVITVRPTIPDRTKDGQTLQRSNERKPITVTFQQFQALQRRKSLLKEQQAQTTSTITSILTSPTVNMCAANTAIIQPSQVRPQTTNTVNMCAPNTAIIQPSLLRSSQTTSTVTGVPATNVSATKPVSYPSDTFVPMICDVRSLAGTGHGHAISTWSANNQRQFAAANVGGARRPKSVLTYYTPILPKMPNTLSVTQIAPGGGLQSVTLMNSAVTIEKAPPGADSPSSSMPVPEKPSISVFREDCPN